VNAVGGAAVVTGVVTVAVAALMTASGGTGGATAISSLEFRCCCSLADRRVSRQIPRRWIDWRTHDEEIARKRRRN